MSYLLVLRTANLTRFPHGEVSQFERQQMSSTLDTHLASAVSCQVYLTFGGTSSHGSNHEGAGSAGVPRCHPARRLDGRLAGEPGPGEVRTERLGRPAGGQLDRGRPQPRDRGRLDRHPRPVSRTGGRPAAQDPGRRDGTRTGCRDSWAGSPSRPRDNAGLLGFDADVAFVTALMGVVYAIGSVVGTLRYR